MMTMEDNDDFVECAGCGTELYKGDLIDGEYCSDCYEEINAELEQDDDDAVS